MRHRHDARTGRAEKTEDEAAHHAFDHEPRVGERRPDANRTREEQWPKADSNKAEEHAEGKEDAEWFFRAETKEARRGAVHGSLKMTIASTNVATVKTCTSGP